MELAAGGDVGRSWQHSATVDESGPALVMGPLSGCFNEWWWMAEGGRWAQRAPEE